jgi:hypothetical protein
VTKRGVAMALAAVVLAAGVVAGRERPALELFPERTAQAPAPAADGIDLERLRRGESGAPHVDPFAKRDFGPKAPKPPVARPAKPEAPPLPFQYFGRVTENGKTEVFVLRGDELLAIEPGQTLGEYRVEAVGETSIAFTYLPLKTRHTLELQ